MDYKKVSKINLDCNENSVYYDFDYDMTFFLKNKKSNKK